MNAILFLVLIAFSAIFLSRSEERKVITHKLKKINNRDFVAKALARAVKGIKSSFSVKSSGSIVINGKIYFLCSLFRQLKHLYIHSSPWEYIRLRELSVLW